MGKTKSIRAYSMTGIGSLPHHNIDAALDYAFQFSIPFLPQIPLRNPWEYSIPQGLEGLPGLRIESDGSPFLDYNVWSGRTKAFEEKLGAAFSQERGEWSFEGFEPSAATSSSWQPFLWELSERSTPVAKVQIVGPITARTSLRTTESKRLDQDPEVSHQVFRLILARAIGMARRLKSLGVQPILFVDEPALFILSGQNPTHRLALAELGLLIQALQKESVIVGLHCCSDTPWKDVLALGMDFLSFDTALSLASVVESGDALEAFATKGGRLSLGVVPTSSTESIESLQSNALVSSLLLKMDTPALRPLLSTALWTPACGLALHTPKDAATVLTVLQETVSKVAKRFPATEAEALEPTTLGLAEGEPLST
jgi:hypothetical protein